MSVTRADRLAADVMTIDFGQRDLRGTDVYADVEEHFRRLHAPAFGRASAAADPDPDPRPAGTAIAFTGTIFTELAGAGTARVCLAESGTVTTLTDGPGEQRYPRFSPDGSLLAYLSDAGRAGDYQPRIRDLAVGIERMPEPVPGTVEYLQFAPDGRHILLGMAGHGADRSGGEGSGTTARMDDGLPDWQPEVYAGPAADQWRSAWVVDVVTGAARQVSPAGRERLGGRLGRPGRAAGGHQPRPWGRGLVHGRAAADRAGHRDRRPAVRTGAPDGLARRVTIRWALGVRDRDLLGQMGRRG